MKAVLYLLVCLSFAKSALGEAEACTSEKCDISKNCRCSSTTAPLSKNDLPQLISITFDEAIVTNAFDTYWDPLLNGRKNPDGNPISATFFVPHEYTDYEKVKDLYVSGYEIAVHSISKNSLQSYWRNATLDTLVEEFGGQKKIISRFANIPTDDIIGARTPQLQINGDISIEAYKQSDLQYDNSWPTYSSKLLFPYTLDYASTQSCTVSNKCPVEAHPGFWILPITNIKGSDNIDCNTLVNCAVEGSEDEIAAWLLGEVDRISASNKAPITILINSAWFEFTDNSYNGFVKFLDGLAKRSDVFLVSQKQSLDWIKSPVKLAEFKTETYERSVECNPVNCELSNVDGNTRYMKSCIACPETYPWVGNPYGELDPDNPISPTPTDEPVTIPPDEATTTD